MVIIRRVIITITAPNKNLLSLSWSYLSGEPFKLGRLAVGVRIVPLLKKLCTLVRMILIHVLFCLIPDKSTETDKNTICGKELCKVRNWGMKMGV